MKKRFQIMMVVLCCLMIMIPTLVLAEDSIIASNTIKVQLNGEYMDFTDAEGNAVNPQIIHNRTMVPMRKVFEALGATVEWDGETKTITAKTEEQVIILVINQEMATVQDCCGNQTQITLDSVPVIIENRTLVPVRFIAESLGRKVDWDDAHRTVIIIDQDMIAKRIAADTPTLYRFLTQENLNLDSYVATGNFGGKLKYTDKENRENLSTLTINGEYTSRVNATMASMDISINYTGKGALMEALEEADLTTMTMCVVLDAEKGTLYLQSNLLNEEYKQKWVRITLAKEQVEQFQEAFNAISANSKLTALENIEKVTFHYTNFDVDSYQILDNTLKTLCNVFGENHFTMTEKTGNRRVYTLKMELEDLQEILELFSIKLSDVIYGLTNVAIEDEKNMMDFALTSDYTIKDDVPSQTNTNVTCGFAKDDESVSLELNLESKMSQINQEVVVTTPKSRDVVEWEG